MANKTLTQLAGRVQDRLPTGLDTTLLVTTLNELYQQSTLKPLKWNLANTVLDFVLGTDPSDTGDVVASLPADFDPGMPAFLSGDPAIGYGAEIPWKSVEEAYHHQAYAVTAAEGHYSIWTFRPGGDNDYQAVLYPASAGPPTVDAVPGEHNLPFVYHKIITAISAGSTFPWPEQFDPLIIDLCEAEIRRTHSWGAWEVPQKKAQDLIANLVEGYLTTKAVVSSLTLETRRAAELEAVRRGR